MEFAINKTDRTASAKDNPNPVSTFNGEGFPE
jgi:hypothetical protein